MAKPLDDLLVQKHLQAMEHADFIAVDTETTGLKVKDGVDYLIGISVAYEFAGILASVYFPIRHNEPGNLDGRYHGLLRNLLDSKPLVFHNLKFDLHSLRTWAGFEPSGNCYDTCTIAHMLYEEWTSKKLDFLANRLLGEGKLVDKLKMWTDRMGWSADIPIELMSPYAAKDAELTYRLFEILWPRMRAEELSDLWLPYELPYTRLLRKIESRGVLVDEDFAQAKCIRGTNRLEDIEDSLGWKPSKPTELHRFLITDMGFPVVALTKGGKPSFDKKAMEEYDRYLQASSRQEARLVAEYRGWQKSVSSLYEKAITLKSPDGRIRPNFKLHGTRTGRNSCEEPNLQQIPRSSSNVWNGDAKATFIAKEGFKLIEFDYAQLEFRLAAMYAKETSLIEAFNKDIDPFLAQAAKMFHQEITKDDPLRDTLKTYTYGKLYGAGYRKTAFITGLDVDYMQDVDTRFGIQYPGFNTISRKAGSLAKSRGFVKYWTGRRRHFPRGREDYPYYKAFNSIVQGGGAELVKRSQLRVAELETDDVYQVLNVHDSLIMEIREDLVYSVVPEVKFQMQNWPEFPVKLTVDAHIWGTKDEL